jgi:hypothetical protein
MEQTKEKEQSIQWTYECIRAKKACNNDDELEFRFTTWLGRQALAAEAEEVPEVCSRCCRHCKRQTDRCARICEASQVLKKDMWTSDSEWLVDWNSPAYIECVGSYNPLKGTPDEELFRRRQRYVVIARNEHEAKLQYLLTLKRKYGTIWLLIFLRKNHSLRCIQLRPVVKATYHQRKANRESNVVTSNPKQRKVYRNIEEVLGDAAAQVSEESLRTLGL